MQYLKPSFTVDLGSKPYRDHYDCVFKGKPCDECKRADYQADQAVTREWCAEHGMPYGGDGK